MCACLHVYTLYSVFIHANIHTVHVHPCRLISTRNVIQPMIVHRFCNAGAAVWCVSYKSMSGY